ncbi:protein PUTATIVE RECOMBINATION INITIATION DEFECT 1 [Diospyros lotus]|uniref:protein PUTATIVE RECOMBINATION INITIATION DEFECT 1 n=1 Tax=Diospyros lotus TaxID=55363 RepID=UPI00224F5CFD|nr:protein PUTATIVE RECOMBINATION INITIATION DEFECT 1 [Diospyros lotus]
MYLYEQERHRYQPPIESQPDEINGDSAASPSACAQGHRSSLNLQTLEGGCICLVCLSNLISNPRSPVVHVSYALSQLSRALSQPAFLRDLLAFHPHFLVSPLVDALSSFDDDPLASQVIDLVSLLSHSCGGSLCGEFAARIASRLSSRALAWSRRQVFALHCLGILLGCQKNNLYSYIKDKDALTLNLVTGLQLPSDEIQGEILFVLYKISILQYACKDEGATDIFCPFCPKLLQLSLDILTKTQSDDVRLNCVALLTVLVQRGFFQIACAIDLSYKNSCEADNFMQTAEHVVDGPPLNMLFAEAVKAPLLSSDTEVQVSTLDLIFLYLSQGGGSGNEIREFVEENIADYVFEILRLSGYRDPVLTSCLQVLDLLSTADQMFGQRLTIGFSTLVPSLDYVAEVPYHPVQTQTLKLIWNYVSNCPGLVSPSCIEELGLILTQMVKKHTDGEMGMLTETFSMACLILVAIMKSPSSQGTPNFSTSVQDASRHAILTCLSHHRNNSIQLMHSLYLLKEAYAYSHEGNSTSTKTELQNSIVNICKTTLLPWFMTAIHEIEEDVVLGVLEAFHSILLHDSDVQATEFANFLVSSSWFSFSFGCLGLFPTEMMKLRVYLMFSSIVDVIQGNNFGQPIRDAASHLPSDPVDLLFLLGQKSYRNLELLSCQSAVLLILYTSSLHDDGLADEKLVLASLEQYILVNSSGILCGAVEPVPMELLVNLYGLYRGLAKMSYQISYSLEAEHILFHLMAEKVWDLVAMRIHPISLKWLFQQEKICKLLSNQILELCRCNSSYGNRFIMYGGSSQKIDVHAIAELVALEDNFAARLLVCLLKELLEEHEEDDIVSVVSAMAVMVDKFPAASDQLCLHGIGSGIRSLCYQSRHSSSQAFMVTCQLTFCILHLVNSASLSDNEAWLAITIELIEYLVPRVAADSWTEESSITIGILCLMLHHSTNKALVETSKSILLSSSLVSIMNNTIHVACSRGPALLDCDEGTKTGEILLLVLLLNFFSLQSIHAVLPGSVDLKILLDQDNGKQPLSFVSIHCHDLCRLMHFGSTMIKVVASCCLLELFTRISDQENEKSDKINDSPQHLLSVTAALEGLVFCSDIRVAMNCSLCLSIILGWEKLDMELLANRRNNWCRLIVEELAMSLAVPSLASESFMIHHKPAVYVAVALLKQKKVPDWMISVFNDISVRGIVENLSASNVSTEIVLLFRELMNAGYIKPQHIANLNRLFQACRKYLYTNDVHDTKGQEDMDKEVAAIPGDTGEVRQVLVRIMSSHSFIGTESNGLPNRNRLLEEIELFSKSLMEEDSS